MNKKQKRLLIRILASLACLIALLLADGLLSLWWLKLLLYLIPYLIVGYDILAKAGRGICNRQVFDENFLMAIATLGAFGVGIYHALNGGDDDYLEAVAVMLFYQVGELFQSYAIGKSRRSISELMDIRPDYANIEMDGEVVRVDPDDVEIGTIIIVNPGEKIPLDGIITEGTSTLNTAALTGESVPRDVAEGAEVLSGCINLTGVLKIQTTAAFEESTASKILDLVENAASRKSKSEKFISRFAKYYTPIVCIAALALAVLPPVISLIIGAPAQTATWIYRACTFLVISCPCAVVISIPLSFFAGLGGASSQGILVKGSNFLEALSYVKYVVFDKTGTITQGSFEVCGVHHHDHEGEHCHEPETAKDGTIELPDEEILRYAAYIESHSSHPIAASLIKAYANPVDASRVTDLKEISGKGVVGKVDDHIVACGNAELMQQEQIHYHDCISAGTIVHLAVDGKYAGHIVISDQVKDTAAEAIQRLKEIGIKKTVMLTGDAQKPAKQIAEDLGITEYHAKLLPADKVAEVERLLAEKEGKENLAFVGDGINDAPVLTRADIGIAMGALGSDAAIEAADVVLMDDDPRKIGKAIRIARKCMNIVRQNLTFSLGIKLICLILGAVGIANMWIAVVADVGVMIIAVLNALRALYVKRLS